MSDFFNFASNSPFLTFFLACIVGGVIRAAFRLITRLYRMIMVASRGWPPAHLDADGDWKPTPEKDSA